MRAGWHGLVAVVAVAVLVSGLGPVAGALASTPVGPPTDAAASLVTDASALPSGVAAQPMPGDARVSLTLTLVAPHPSLESAFLSAVSDPASPSYRHFLTYAEYVRAFAPSPGAVAVVVAALAAGGARSVAVSPDRAAVTATLTPPEVSALFGVSLVEYRLPGARTEYTATGTAHLPPGLAGRVAAVDGLSSAANAGLSLDLAPTAPRPWAGGAGPSQFVIDNPSGDSWFVGSDYTRAFQANRLFPGTGSVPNATFPTGVAIATLLAGAFNQSTGQDLPPWDPAVLSAYFNGTLPAAWPHPSVVGVPVTIGSLTPPPPGSFGGLNDSTLDEFENSLDVEMAGSLAPGASVYNFYFAGSLLAGPTPTGAIADDFAQSLSEALAYNYSPAHLAVVSGSFGLPDLNNSFWNVELAAAAATGVTVVASSGDQGNAPDNLTGRQDGPWPVWPASASFNTSGAVSIGGLSLSLSGAPTSFYNGSSLNLSYDASVAGVASASAWYAAGAGPGTVAGTEGGISTVYPEPPWQLRSAAQVEIVNATLRQGATTLGRAEPDVALPANATIATVVANASGAIFFSVLAGTSVAAPVFAGLLADLVAVESARSPSGWAPLGFFDPTLYRIASYYELFPGSPNDPFYDVTNGSNYVFAAGPGWDATTGWGAVIAPLLLAADENATVRGYTYIGPTPGLPSPTAPTPPVPWLLAVLILAAGGATAIALVVVFARPSRSRRAPVVPYGAQGLGPSSFGPGVQGNVYPGATFLCPYCGTVRPAEPVRCPRCGAL